MINLCKKTATAILFLFFLVLTNLGFAQILEEESSLSVIQKFKYSVSNELGGHAYIYSLNFEKIIHFHPGFASSVSIGAGLPFSDQSKADDPSSRSSHYIVPMQYNFMFGRQSSFLDIGVTATYVHSKYDLTDKTSNAILPSYRVGYRFQGNDGFLFKLAYTPIYFRTPHAGLSLGWSF